MSGATSFTSVPIVDISGRRSQDRAERERVAGEIGSASEVGFFSERRRVDDACSNACWRDEGVLRAAARGEDAVLHRAVPVPSRLRPVGEEGVESGTPDLKEAFDTALDLPADDPDYLAGNPMLGPNTWPDLPGFADAVTAYYHAVLDVGHRLLWAFAVALGEDPTPSPARHQDAEPATAGPLPVQPRTPRTARASARTPTTNASPCSSPPRRASRCSTARASGSTCRRCPAPSSSTSATCWNCGPTVPTWRPATGSAR